jgi:hypothetical protein
VWTADEFRTRLVTEDHFLTTLLREPRLMVVGDERKLEELGRKPVAEVPPKLPRRSGHSARSGRRRSRQR